MNSSSFFTIVQLSDFHYDLEYAAGSSSNCIEDCCCRNTSIVSWENSFKTIVNYLHPTFQYFEIFILMVLNNRQPKENSTAKAGYWGDYGVCDSPGHLIENICSQVATNHKVLTTQPRPVFIHGLLLANGCCWKRLNAAFNCQFPSSMLLWAFNSTHS